MSNVEKTLNKKEAFIADTLLPYYLGRIESEENVTNRTTLQKKIATMLIFPYLTEKGNEYGESRRDRYSCTKLKSSHDECQEYHKCKESILIGSASYKLLPFIKIIIVEFFFPGYFPYYQVYQKCGKYPGKYTCCIFCVHIDAPFLYSIDFCI